MRGEYSWSYENIYALDCWGNAFSGGSAKHTISARIGWRAHTGGEWRWRALQWLVNFAFMSVDGPAHCYDAYITEKAHAFVQDNNNIRYALVLVLVVLFAIPIAVLLWSRHYFIRIRANILAHGWKATALELLRRIDIL